MDIEFRNICRSFGKVKANQNISFFIPSGTIQGILGENGAGKSTLMNILSGYYSAGDGKILLGGKEAQITNPASALKSGIGMLHQDPLDFPPMKVIDDFIIGQQGKLIPDRDGTIKEFLALQEQFGFSINPQAFIDTLTVGERQQVEILRLLWLGVQVLILDEPTTGISAIQKTKLFATLRTLASQGKTILFVSHKLEDVESLCQQVVVLRKGKLVGELKAPFDAEKLVALMFGKAIAMDDKEFCTPGETVLKLENVTIEERRLTIHDVTLEVRCGEVIGLAGMEGSGQDLLLRACAGLIRPVAGKIAVKGMPYQTKDYLEYLANGVTFLPASRMEEGLIEGLSIAEHVTLAEEQVGFFIDTQKMTKLADDKIDKFSIKGFPHTRVEALSGGNQQRTLLALLRETLALILLEHPTRGLDIESSIYIWKRLRERCNHGTAILFISPDLEEILQYSDRILVFFSGRISPPIEASQTSVEHLGHLIGGKGWEEFASHRSEA